jgi:large conductance mechanosensitive channel
VASLVLDQDAIPLIGSGNVAERDGRKPESEERLVEIAVAFVMAASFALVVQATVTMLLDIIGKLGGTPDFSNWSPGGVSVGAWITAVISFVIMAAVVYFFVVVPYVKAREMMAKDDEAERSGDRTDDSGDGLKDGVNAGPAR